ADAQPLAIARAAAVSAFRAGAPVHEAIALGVDLVSVRGRVTDEHSLSTYAAAGSAAGLLHRSGATPEAASEAARSLIRMAEIMPSGQVATAAVDPLGLPAGPQRRHGILNLAYRDAAAGLGAMKTRVDRMDRSAHGADLSALTAAARQLFVEKGYTAAELPAIAAEKARQQRAKLDDRADQAEAVADEAHLAVLAASAEPAKLEPTLPRSGGWSAASLLAPLRGGGAQAANPNAPALTLARATLDRAQQRHALASQGAAAARHDADQAGGEHGERLELAVSVLCAAHRAAPDNQHAAMVAARVACETFRAPGDAPRARFAADTAHLALLAGAPESDAIAIAHLAAESHDAAAPAGYSADDLRALQVAHVQVASPGGATPLDEAGSRARSLAATAAVDLLAQANPDHQTASRLMGSLVSGTRPAPERPATATAPLFLHADATAAKSPAPSLPAIPEHYEPVASTLSGEHAPLVKDWGHAKIREVRNHGFHAADGNAKTTYLIEMPGPKGKVWTEFSWSPNSNQLYGEIDVKPRNARDGEQAGHGKVLVAYNGTTGEWESFEKRTRDLKEKTLGVLDDMATLLESRDVGTGDWELPYSSSQSGFMQNVKHPYQTQIEEEIRLFVQGRHSQPQFKTRMSDLFIKMSKDLEGDRSRKKAIMRHQIDTALRLFSAAAGASLGSARVAASFS
ncbi:hypothetical protein, partial [Burkholderia sp. Cy-637]|uniref:hypothetical protein n=1 Tax=Burkholderia sp. Cy-637 TaxID=2608327 RepID=UPI001421F163